MTVGSSAERPLLYSTLPRHQGKCSDDSALALDMKLFRRRQRRRGDLGQPGVLQQERRALDADREHRPEAALAGADRETSGAA